MTEETTGPPCPLCPGRRMSRLGAGWLCPGCANTWSAGRLDDSRDPPMEVLMQAPVTPQGRGGGGARGRRVEKAGTRQARRQARRWEQDGHGAPVGRPERPKSESEPVGRMWGGRLTADGVLMLDAACNVLEVSEAGVARMALHALHLRLTTDGVTLCPTCRFPGNLSEPHCRLCGRGSMD